MINPDRLTVKSGEALNEAQAEARRFGNPMIYDTHLLHVLLGQEESIVVPVLQKLGASVTALREQVQREIARYPKQSDAQPNVSRSLQRLSALGLVRLNRNGREATPEPVAGSLRIDFSTGTYETQPLDAAA